MIIKTGCDIVSTERFTQAIERSDTSFLKRIFTPLELARAQTTHTLMGIFAAKESIIKALDLPADSWLTIEIAKLPSGKPIAYLLDYDTTNVMSSDISIAHDGAYACAISCFLLKGQ